MGNGKIKVLYIAGNGRSGSTILDVILGQVQGFFAVGEIHRAWDNDVIEQSLCGCGEPFRTCPTWHAIFREGFGGLENVDTAKMSRLKMQFTAQKRLLSKSMGRRPKPAENEDLKTFLATLDKLYGAISRVTNCRVIVDASKWPLYAYMLGLLPSVELYVVHLVRDPRAVAFSWTRKKEFQPGTLLPRQSPFKTTLYWLALNPAIGTFFDRGHGSKYFFLPYERFVTDPRGVLSHILNFVGEEGQELPSGDARTLELHHTHAVAGNEVRLNRGQIKVRLDDEWKRQMPWSSKLLVSAMTWPLLYTYGYFDDAA